MWCCRNYIWQGERVRFRDIYFAVRINSFALITVPIRVPWLGVHRSRRNSLNDLTAHFFPQFIF